MPTNPTQPPTTPEAERPYDPRALANRFAALFARADIPVRSMTIGGGSVIATWRGKGSAERGAQLLRSAGFSARTESAWEGAAGGMTPAGKRHVKVWRVFAEVPR